MKNNIRFIFSLILLLLALLIITFITEPYAPENVLMQVPKAAGILVMGLLWGLIIWLPIRLFQGNGRAPGMQRFIFITAVVVSILYIIFQAGR
jgi:hypothetical protein